MEARPSEGGRTHPGDIMTAEDTLIAALDELRASAARRRELEEAVIDASMWALEADCGV